MKKDREREREKKDGSFNRRLFRWTELYKNVMRSLIRRRLITSSTIDKDAGGIVGKGRRDKKKSATVEEREWASETRGGARGVGGVD